MGCYSKKCKFICFLQYLFSFELKISNRLNLLCAQCALHTHAIRMISSIKINKYYTKLKVMNVPLFMNINTLNRVVKRRTPNAFQKRMVFFSFSFFFCLFVVFTGNSLQSVISSNVLNTPYVRVSLVICLNLK